QPLRAGAGVVAAGLVGLVGGEEVVADAELVLELGGRLTPGDGFHAPHRTPAGPPEPQSSVSGLNSSPVSSLGKKYVDFGGMLSPAAATARTCSTGVGPRKNAASYSPRSTSASASSAWRA